MRFSLYRRWRNPKAEEEARVRQAAAVAEYVARARSGNPRLEALQAERMKLLKPQAEALGKGDLATYQRYEKELKPIEAQLQALYQESEAQDRLTLRASAVRDQDVTFSLAVNEPEMGLGEVRPVPPPCPQALAFRVTGGEDDRGAWHEGTVTVFLGPWKARAIQGSGINLRAPVSVKAGYVNPQSIMVQVTGDEARVASLLKAMDWEALRGLLARR